MHKRQNPYTISYFLIFYLVMLAVLSSGAFAEVSSPQTYTLSFRILEAENGSPLADANVSISGPVTQSILSGPDGFAIFSNIPAGSYSIVARAPNYAIKLSQSVTLTSNTTIILLFSTTKAIFDYRPFMITTKTVVYFDASQSSSSGEITGYKWDFGDNTTETNVTTSHIFVALGQYRVSLTVTSTVGTATFSQTLTVIKSNGNNYTPLLILIPLPLLIFWMYKRRKYYVVIQSRIPPDRKNAHCPGDDTECENCSLTPC